MDALQESFEWFLIGFGIAVLGLGVYPYNDRLGFLLAIGGTVTFLKGLWSFVKRLRGDF